MNGILAVNHFLSSNKFNLLHRHLLKSAERSGVTLEIKTNLQLAFEPAMADFVLFWDKDINLARRIEKDGTPVFNNSESIMKCDDKARTYIELLEKIPQPKTVIAPKTYFSSDFSEFVDSSIKNLGLPLVFKECFGSFGEQVFLCRTKKEIISHITERPFILQEFIKESAGHDVRLEVVGNQVICAMERINENDFRANITNGGKMKPYTPTEKEKEAAIKACRILGLSFGGVDMLDGNILCEVNSNAHILNIMECTGIDIAPYIFDEIRKSI